MAKQAPKPERTAVQNRKARHDYTLEDKIEAGLVLQGWEVKSLREGRGQLKESYVILKNGEAFLIGAHISPTKNISTHITANPTRTRKLLLQRRELNRLQKAKERDGYTLIALDIHWSHNRAKLQLAIAKGKKLHDKREASKDRDWNREQQRLFRGKTAL